MSLPNAKSHVSAFEEGFSLLEVVVALGILSLAMGFIYEEVVGTVKKADVAYNRTYDLAVAQSLMEETIAKKGWAVDATSGTRDGRAFTREISFNSSKDKEASNRLMVLKVKVGSVDLATIRAKEIIR